MKILGGFILSIILLFSFRKDGTEIVRMNTTSFQPDICNVQSVTIDINDTLHNKTIQIYSDNRGFPIQYSRNISTGVCIDGECRLVHVNLFWNTTGRYLGFKLPDGEFFSKTQHTKFRNVDYDLLQDLLADANSPLANYTLEELVPRVKDLTPDIDAISSATNENVLDYIVEGAVYTTYTLWHIANGPTKQEIEKQSIKLLDAGMALEILNCNILSDQLWVLNNLPAHIELSPELQNKLLELIPGKDIYLSERALHALKPDVITNEIQLELATIFQNSGFLQKRLILQKFKETDKLNIEISAYLTAELESLNATLTKSVLELYTIHSVYDANTVASVIKLLKTKNQYISNQAIRYLENLDNPDKRMQRLISKYKVRNS